MSLLLEALRVSDGSQVMQVLKRTLVFPGSPTPLQVFSTTSTCKAELAPQSLLCWVGFPVVLLCPMVMVMGIPQALICPVSRCNSSICVQGFPSPDLLGICSKGLCGKDSAPCLCAVDGRCPVQHVGHAGPAAPPCITTDMGPLDRGQVLEQQELDQNLGQA